MSGLWSEQTGVKFVLAPFFLPHSEHVVGSIRVFDDDSGIRGRSSVPLWGAASMSASALELQSWYRYPVALQASVCNMIVIRLL